MRNKLERMVSGYHGEDSMRDNARKMFAGELKEGARYKEREPMSSPARTNLRLYAEGGSVDSNGIPMKRGGHYRRQHRRHALTHEQHDMHIPRRVKTPRLNIEKFSEAEDMKHGGHSRHHQKHHEHNQKHHEHRMHEGHHMMHKSHSHRGHRKHHYADGGSLADSLDRYFRPAADFASKYAPRTSPYLGRAYNAIREYAPRAQGMFNRARGFYDTAKQYAPRAQEFISKFSPEYGEKFGRVRSMLGLKRGGKAHHRGHDRHHYEEGGSVYEHEMLGEHPSHHRPHINYEREMRGEREISRPRQYRTHNPGAIDESHPHHYAMGGVGKIRHKQADKYGRPYHHRTRRDR